HFRLHVAERYLHRVSGAFGPEPQCLDLRHARQVSGPHGHADFLHEHSLPEASANADRRVGTDETGIGSMSGEKTEKPTPRRLEDQRKEGQVPQRKNVVEAALLTYAVL